MRHFQDKILTAFVFMLVATPALAERRGVSWLPRKGGGNGQGSGGGQPDPVAVPEIDASAGLLALAAVLAVVLFMWERNRRQSIV